MFGIMRLAAGHRLDAGRTLRSRDRRLHRIRFEVLEGRTLSAHVTWVATSSGNWDSARIGARARFPVRAMTS